MDRDLSPTLPPQTSSFSTPASSGSQRKERGAIAAQVRSDQAAC